jgi:hypothetical protein
MEYPNVPPSVNLLKPMMTVNFNYFINTMEYFKQENWNPVNSLRTMTNEIIKLIETYGKISESYHAGMTKMMRNKIQTKFNNNSPDTSKKINIIVLGLKRELSVLRIKKFLGNKYKNKVFYFSELTDNYSIEDQLQIANNSLGYVGSATGHVTLFHYLNKKSVIFDSIKYTKFQTSKAFLKNKIVLYKKIEFKGQLVDCHIDYIKKSSSSKFIDFKEVTFNELKFNICKLFKI